MNINVTITVTILAITGLGLAWGILWGLLRGAMRSVTRLITLVLAAVIAVIVTGILTDTVVPMIEPTITELVKSSLSGDIGDIVEAADSLTVYLIEVVCALISPVLYLVVFVVASIVLLLLYLLITVFFPSKKKHPLSTSSRVVGAVVSAVGALIITVSLLMPFTGYIAMASTIYPTLRKNGVLTDDIVPAEIDEQILAGCNNPLVKFVNLCGGNLLFEMTSVTEDSNASEELNQLIDTISAVVPGIRQLVEDNTFEEDEIKPLNMTALYTQIIPAIENNSHLTEIFDDIFTTAALKWKEGETFLGLNVNDMLGTYAGSAQILLDRLADKNVPILTRVKNFGTSMETLSNAYVYFNMVSNTEHTRDDLSEKANELFKNMDKDTAEVISEALSEEIIKGALVTDDSSKTVIDIVKDTILEIAADGTSEEEKQAATDAINEILSYSSEARRDEEHESAMIDSMLTSSILSNKILNLASGNAAAVTPEEKHEIQISKEKKAELDSIIDGKMTEYEGDSEKLAVLDALKDLFVIGAESIPVTTPSTETTPETPALP